MTVRYWLHILGPAAAPPRPAVTATASKSSADILPSLDPSCLAAVALLQHTLRSGDWAVCSSLDAVPFAAHGRTASAGKTAASTRLGVVLEPSDVQDLPALYHLREPSVQQHGSSLQTAAADELVVVKGFDAIVEYLAPHHNATSVLHADTKAFSSHMQLHGQALVDLALYVSSHTYSSYTRRALTASLPFPLAYVVPPERRRLADARTAHLGVLSADLDSLDDEAGDADRAPPSREHSSSSGPMHGRNLPALMKASLTSRVTQQQHRRAARTKLEGMLDTLCHPLDTLLQQHGSAGHPGGDTGYLLSATQPTALDCLALAYLSLLCFSPTATINSKERSVQDWTGDFVQREFPLLHHYITSEARRVLNAQTLPWTHSGSSTLRDTPAMTQTSSHKAQSTTSVATLVTARTIRTLASATLPSPGHHLWSIFGSSPSSLVLRARTKRVYSGHSAVHTEQGDILPLPIAIAVVATGLAGLATTLSYVLGPSFSTPLSQFLSFLPTLPLTFRNPLNKPKSRGKQVFYCTATPDNYTAPSVQQEAAHATSAEGFGEAGRLLGIHTQGTL